MIEDESFLLKCGLVRARSILFLGGEQAEQEALPVRRL
jgi:hypothetical protein